MLTVLRIISASMALAIVLLLSPVPAAAQPLQKAVLDVGAGNTVQTGANFRYRLTYRCNATVGNCVGATVTDVLPPQVVFVSALGTSDVASISAPSVGTNGTVTFTMINPLPAGNSGDLIITVRFPNGSTPNGTVATNVATGTNLAPPAPPFTTPPVSVTAVATPQITTTKTLLTSPANLDQPESYRLRISVPNNNGALNLTAIGPVTDTLPTGTVFTGATPAADCQPGCVGTTPATLTWTAPCSVPLVPGGNCDIIVNVTFPSATFTSGTNVTNSFTATVTPLGAPAQPVGPGSVTHPVTTFVPAPSANLSKGVAGGSPNPPTLNQVFSYSLGIGNNGNVPLDNLVVTDTLPVAFALDAVTTGSYTGIADFGAGEGVRVTYEKNTAPGVFTLWGSSPNVGTNTTLTSPPPGLVAGEYITRVRWAFGTAQPGAVQLSAPLLTGRIINPNNAGGPTAIGDTIQNCVDLTAVYTAGPTNVSRNICAPFTLSGPFVQFNPVKENLSGGPFSPGQNVNFRLRVHSAPQSSDPVALADVIVTDLLPANLSFVSWAFDAQGTGLPAPQVFNQIPNFAGTGRTLLRWRWNAGSGNLGVNQQVWINLTTQVRNGAIFGALTNDLTLEHDAPPLGQRCSGASQPDTLDYDGDGNVTETLCRESETINIAPIAQLVSGKAVRNACDAGFVPAGTPNLGTLPGAEVVYRLRVTNVGTVPMNNFVLVDLLPRVGDTGVLDTSPRNSQWQPRLAAPITPPAGTTIFYTTAVNPCRGEVGGPTTGCNAPNWSISAPDPLSATTAIRVDFGSRTINPFDSIEFFVPMVAPAVIPAGAANNSFAYLAARADGVGNLNAEPNLVSTTQGSCSIEQALGDFVWIDEDGDGIQDSGEPGLNGVTVRLFGAGADGIVGTPDDVLVVQSITQDGPGAGNPPGWYRFANLDPGTYRVCIVPPANFAPTLSDQGGNDAIDSDGNPLTRCSGPVVLNAGAINPTIDFGLVRTAALGNYVWFDTDADGIQDEPLTNGVNGVTVRLYADNGDGNIDPAGDTLVAVTATANDSFGRPGYYLFQDLIPGLRYFVQFALPAAATGFTLRDAGGNDAADSDANPAAGPLQGTTPFVVLAAGELNATVDAGLLRPSGPLALGDVVWIDTDNDGVYEPEAGEQGVDNVVVSLYRDVNNNNLPELGEFLAQTATATSAGQPGIYRFSNLPAGGYIVVIDASNFTAGGALVGFTPSTPVDGPNADTNGRNKGVAVNGVVRTQGAVTLTVGGEPTNEDGDPNTNLTIDFGFIVGAAPPIDFGDNPDVGPGTGLSNYNTVAFDNGASHRLDGAGSPVLGQCVDADTGLVQGVEAGGDDAAVGAATIGTCAVAGDDEDGVLFPTVLARGTGNTFTARALGGRNDCQLNGWIDYNRNGVFTDAGEQVATNLLVAAGGAPVNFVVNVPVSAAGGATWARFRCTSAAGAGPVGPVADGEVEDYRVEIGAADFGDAPASYATQGAGAAQHTVDPLNALYLGSCVDFEVDGQPSVGADGDDLGTGTGRVGLCSDDEDGVVFTAPPAACAVNSLTVTVNRPGRLDAFIDLGGDGGFGAGDQVITNAALSAGANNLTFNLPCNQTPRTTYARFRVSSAGGLGPAGSAADGEVEDYRITLIGNDLGDAPAPFPTTFATGAVHRVDPANLLRLGACVDTDIDGQPAAGADGDDLNAVAGNTTGLFPAACAAGADDEDGVVATPLVACRPATFTVTVNLGTGPARLDAWIDWNRNGNWTDAGEQIADDLAAVAGANAVAVTVPCGANPGIANARFRISGAGVGSFGGLAADGEVEDYQFRLIGTDFGDAPASYGTLLAADGARHAVIPGTSGFLGACVDTELDGQPNPTATGDDTNLAGAPTSVAGTCSGNDDEDGVTLPAFLAACRTVSYGLTASTAGFVDAWIDFNGDGDFNDAGEQILTDSAVTAGSNSRTVTVPCNARPGSTYARFRYASQAATVTGPVGFGADGEVEDYRIDVRGNDLGDAPASYGTLLAASGPAHLIDPASNVRLGACVDGEADGQPAAAADGDDVNALGTPSVVVGTCAGNDDEDGISFGSTFTACKPFLLTATLPSGASGFLNGFIDFNGDGDFDLPGERALTNVAVSAGANALSLDVPCNATAGTKVARFRLTATSGGANPLPTGNADDGEVEDYVIAGAQEGDQGDAPDSYLTTRAAGGPLHGVGTGATLFLGTCVDTEVNGQPNATATGDDTNALGAPGLVAGTCTGGDDEDGVVFTTPVTSCNTSTVTVTASQAGRLDAWIDFGRDGSFNQPVDRITPASGLAVVAGANVLNVTAPCPIDPGPTFSRFRLTPTGTTGIGIGGTTPAGEVEDHALVTRGTDLGDAPASYGTLLAGNGPVHGITAGFFLGARVDSEPNGQPSIDADGDDLNPPTADDEDGVVFSGGNILNACTTQTATVTFANATPPVANPRLDAWIDFNGNGTFDSPAERITASGGLALTVGANPLTFNVPCTLAPRARTYARFRLSSGGVATPLGPAFEGEVEDYVLEARGIDLGDAPAPAATLLANDGPRHGVLPVGNPVLGACVDTETDGQPTSAADGDDTGSGATTVGTCATPGDDEDGVVFPELPLVSGTQRSIRLNAGASGGVATCWLDFNRDGAWTGAGEPIVVAQPIAAGASVVTNFAVPPGLPTATVFTRCRIASTAVSGPLGFSADGEIEDHAVAMVAESPRIGLAKRLLSIGGGENGVYTVEFELVARNAGNVPLSAVQVTDDLRATFPTPVGIAVQSVTATGATPNFPGYNGTSNIQLLAAGASLPVGGQIVIRLRVNVDINGAPIGPYNNSATVTGRSPANVVVDDISQDGIDPDPDGNGNPNDNSQPTRVQFPPRAIPVDAGWALALLVLLMLVTAGRALRPRRPIG